MRAERLLSVRGANGNEYRMSNDQKETGDRRQLQIPIDEKVSALLL